MRIGIDLGGTKIEGIVLDTGGVERLRRRIATPTASYEETLADPAIAAIINTTPNGVHL